MEDLTKLTDDELLKRYNEISDKESYYKTYQMALKILGNSCYGSIGYVNFRYYDLRNAVAITHSGQVAIRWVENRINKYLNNLFKTDDDYVIAVDTDSVMIDMDRLVKTVMPKETDIDKIVDFLNKCCQEKFEPFFAKCYDDLYNYLNAYKQSMVQKLEIIGNKSVFVAKKRYIINVLSNEGVRYETPKKKIMGLEIKKSSTPYKCKEFLNTSIDIILNGTEDELIKYIKECQKEFSKSKIEEISFPRGVKDIQKYADDVEIFSKGCPIHTKGALIYNHKIEELGLSNVYEKIYSGDKIKFIYLQRPNTFHNNNVLTYKDSFPDKLGLKKYIDYVTQFEKSFLEPLRLILNSIGWKTKKEISLESFM